MSPATPAGLVIVSRKPEEIIPPCWLKIGPFIAVYRPIPRNCSIISSVRAGKYSFSSQSRSWTHSLSRVYGAPGRAQSPHRADSPTMARSMTVASCRYRAAAWVHQLLLDVVGEQQAELRVLAQLRVKKRRLVELAAAGDVLAQLLERAL